MLHLLRASSVLPWSPSTGRRVWFLCPLKNRTGQQLQASWQHLVASGRHYFLAGEEDGRDQSKLETKVWEAHNPLIDKQIDQFLVVAR